MKILLQSIMDLTMKNSRKTQLPFSEFPSLPLSQIRRRMNQVVGEDGN